MSRRLFTLCALSLGLLALDVDDQALAQLGFNLFGFLRDSRPTIEDAGSDRYFNAQFTQTATILAGAQPMTYSWTKLSGPGNVTFGSPAALTTTIDADTDGTYVVLLTVTDALGRNATATVTLVRDTVAPPALAAFSVKSGYPMNGQMIVSFTLPSTVPDYDRLEIRKLAGTTLPSAACNDGAVLKSYSSFAANALVTFFDSGTPSGAYSYRACVYDKAGNITTPAAQTAQGVIAYKGNPGPPGPTCTKPPCDPPIGSNGGNFFGPGAYINSDSTRGTKTRGPTYRSGTTARAKAITSARAFCRHRPNG